ncbi:MAG: glutamate--tRNA ligase [Capsulimonadaceae bacterium]
MSDVRVRFAPSPTGMLHIGGVRTALWDWLFAKRHGGKFILRIEDTDKSREVEGGVAQIMEALRWYGLEWDEGPDIGGPHAPYIQSQRLEHYRRYAEQLVASGHAYRAYDSEERLQAMRDEQQRRGFPSGYDRLHRGLTAEERAEYERSGAPSVIRLATPREGRTSFVDAVFGEISFENKVLDDAILLKSDGFPTYHLAHVVDDHLMRISHVLRGEEWISSTPLHILLFQAMGWEPPVYAHLAVMLNKDGKKLAKRDKTGTALSYRDDGYLRGAMINFLALQGWSEGADRDIYGVDDLIERFSLEGLTNRSPKVDFDKLLWYNGVYIRSLTLPQLAESVLPFLQRSGLVDSNPTAETLDYIGRVMALEQERLKTLSEAPAIADFFLLDDDAVIFDQKALARWFGSPGVRDRLTAVREGLAGVDVFDHPSIEAVVREVIARFEVKGGDVIHPLRVAVTGRSTGPGLFESMDVLGKARVLRRLDRALSMVTA